MTSPTTTRLDQSLVIERIVDDCMLQTIITDIHKSYMPIIVMKKLNGHQIDVLRRAITFLIARDGKARLVILASYLLTLDENGFACGDWCGYGKLRPMIEAYPEFFEIYGSESTDMSVRIVGNQGHGVSHDTKKTIDMNFDHFVYKYITPDLAEEIRCEYNLTDGMEDYCVFCNFLRYTYYKAEKEGKSLEHGNIRMFHTGWFHNNTDAVFMVWGYDANGKAHLYFTRRSCKDGRDLIRLFGNREPQLADFPVLQFDTNLHIEPEYGHIIDEHADRIPEEIIDMLRHNPDLQGNDENLSNQEIVHQGRNFLRRLLDGCIMDTRKRLANRSDEAVLFWNKRTDKMCWLIPMRLGITEKVNLTLVVEPSVLNGESTYRAHTILPLKEAFKCARLLGPVRAEWLKDAWKDNNK